MFNGVRGAILTNPKMQHKGKASSCGLQHEFDVYQSLSRHPYVGILTAKRNFKAFSYKSNRLGRGS